MREITDSDIHRYDLNKLIDSDVIFTPRKVKNKYGDYSDRAIDITTSRSQS